MLCVKRLILLLFGALSVLLVTACGAPAAPSDTTVSTTNTPRVISGMEQALAARPLSPALVDEDFREDPAFVVGNTGRPQLVEVFHYD